MGTPLKEIFARFGIDFDTKSLERGGHLVQDISARVADLVKKVSSPALVSGIANFTRGMVEQGLEIGDNAREIGMSANAIREWQHVAGASGVPIEVMNQGLRTLAENARGAVTGNGDAAYAFRRLHIQVRDTNRQLRPTGDLMAEAGLQIARIANPITRARVSMQMFGESGRLLAPIFERGGTSINRMREEVRDLMGGDLDELTEQSRQVRIEQSKSKLAWDALSTTLALQFLPVFRVVTVTISKTVAWFKKLLDGTSLMQAAIIVFGGVFAAQMLRMGIAALQAFMPAIVATGPYVLALMAVVAVVDDILTLFDGGKSVIGDWVDALFGIGTAAQAVQDLKMAYEATTDAIADAAIATERFFSRVSSMAEDAGNAIVSAIVGALQRVARLPGIGTAMRAAGINLDTAALSRTVRSVGRVAFSLGPASMAVNALTEMYRSQQGARVTGSSAGDDGRRTNVRGVPGAPSARVGRNSVSAAVRQSTRVQVNNTTPITIQVPNADPEAVGAVVHRRISDEARNNLRAARNALVPVVESEG